MNQLNSMQDLLMHDIQMMHSAETQALEGMTAMIQGASDPQLKAAFEKHGVETQQQIARLEQIMTMMDIKPTREANSAVKGLISDTEKLLRKDSSPEILDAMLIGAAQKIEHYEIACYGTAVRMTQDLGMTQAAELLRQTLEEEKKTDKLLTDLAEARVNTKAEQKL